MASPTSPPVPVWAGIAFVLLALIRLLTSGRRRSGMPPGPPTLPVIGNAHQIPAHNFYEKYVMVQMEGCPVKNFTIFKLLVSVSHPAKS
jgi:hypothetical protein